MSVPLGYMRIIMELLKNFPAVVLDLKQFNVKPGAETVKTLNFEGSASKIEVKIRVKNEALKDKDYKAIIFITDL